MYEIWTAFRPRGSVRACLGHKAGHVEAMDKTDEPILKAFAEGAIAGYRQRFENPFDADFSAVFRIEKTGSETAFGLVEFVQAPDVYGAMCIARHAALTPETLAVGVTSCGWAAPTDGQVPPSEHPERRRVLMVVMGDRMMNTCSAVLFEGDSEPQLELSKGEGLLAEAFQDMLIGMIVSTAASQN